MEQVYGKSYVCSVGTFTTFQLKMALKDLGRYHGHPPQSMDYINKILDVDRGDSWKRLIENAMKYPQVKEFVLKNVELVNDIHLLHKQPRSASIHACATLILPKEDSNGEKRDIFTWIPVRKEGDLLVSEWEGEPLADAGFLKEDILGIRQLDKFRSILNLIENETGESIDIYNIPLDDPKVYELFRKGWSEDVFHFGTNSLEQFSRELKPDNLDELIAMIALIRPGGIQSNANVEYTQIKFGEKDPEYDYGLKEVTEETHGIYIYQEQIMKAVQVLGGFNPVEADGIRKAVGHLKRDLILTFKDKFVQGAIQKGCPENEAKDIWDKLERFAGYGFNKCLSSDEKLYRLGMNTIGKSTYSPTIGEMYRIKNDLSYAKSINKVALRDRYCYKGYGSTLSLNEKERLVKNKIKDIRYEGKREIFRVTLQSGQYIDVTKNHKFPTPEGERTVEDLRIGIDTLYYNNGYESEDTEYRFTTKSEIKNRFHNNDSKYEYKLNSEKGREGFQKRETSYTKLDFYKKNLKKDYCEECGRKKESVKLEVHHIDDNHSNNEETNLQTLCSSCHKIAHYKLGRVRQGEKGLLSSLSHIKSIKFLKVDDVYDVEMESPYHTFVTDKGIVTCNSHATAYAITGYICQWFKVHYPLQFWSVAFHFAEDKDVPRYISEIHKMEADIVISPPDINNSQGKLYTDFEKRTIYWPLSKIKQVGEVGLSDIIEERSQNGPFKSLEDLYTRSKANDRKINKQVIENLIFSGSFDELEKVREPKDREKILLKYYELAKTKVSDQNSSFVARIQANYWWVLKQREVSGLGYLDFVEVIKNSKLAKNVDRYLDSSDFTDTSIQKRKKIVAGIVLKVTERGSAKTGKLASVLVENNFEEFHIMFWKKQWALYKEKVENSVGKLLIVFGEVDWDSYKKVNQLGTQSFTIIDILD